MKYNDGTLIPDITQSSTWDSCQYAKIGAYCYYDNTTNADSIKKFGALYNWYTVTPSNSKKVAPAGWHVPTDAEWTILEKYLVANGYNWDGTTDTNALNKIAKSIAAKTDWLASKFNGVIGNDLTKNNRSGFSALPGGSRNNDGFFYNLSSGVGWWSAMEYGGAASAWVRTLVCSIDDLSRFSGPMGCGFSVRLVRDSVRLE